MYQFRITALTLLWSVAQLAGWPTPCRADNWDLNQAVWQFAVDNLGQQVGDGQCWTLADRALRYAGAQPPGTGGLGPYEFGRLLDVDEEVWPGDVMQFEGAFFLYENGSWQDMPHHTAIVYTADGSQITLINQNNPEPIVTLTNINLDNLQRGTIMTYRPLDAQ
jgi:hypothetical protein